MSIRNIICIILLIFQFLFLLRLVMSFFPISPRSAAGKVKDLAIAVTDPVVVPVRRALPPVTGGPFAGGGIAEMLVFLILIVLIKITYPR